MPMTEAEQWAAYLAHAQALKAAAGDAPAGGIIGRHITFFVNKLAEFWSDHKATLLPVLNTLAIAALEAILAQRTNISNVNGPGPQ